MVSLAIFWPFTILLIKLWLIIYQTALGNERAALGLAGVAVKAGVKTAIATLWYVDDEATSKVVTHLPHPKYKINLN